MWIESIYSKKVFTSLGYIAWGAYREKHIYACYYKNMVTSAPTAHEAIIKMMVEVKKETYRKLPVKHL